MTPQEARKRYDARVAEKQNRDQRHEREKLADVIHQLKAGIGYCYTPGKDFSVSVRNWCEPSEQLQKQIRRYFVSLGWEVRFDRDYNRTDSVGHYWWVREIPGWTPATKDLPVPGKEPTSDLPLPGVEAQPTPALNWWQRLLNMAR